MTHKLVMIYETNIEVLHLCDALNLSHGELVSEG